MSLIRHAVDRERREANLSALIQAEGRGRGRLSSSGVTVDDDKAMRLAAVWGCVDLIAELVSTLPIHEYRRADRRLVQLSTPPFLEDPAADGYGFEVWARQGLVSWLLRGNLFGWIEQLGGDGWPTQVASLHPDEITARRERIGGPVEWRRDNKVVERWPAGPLWHVPAYTVPGSPVGLSPIRYAAETIGLGLAAMQYDGQWFRDGGVPIGVYESEQTINETQSKDIKRKIKDALVDNRETLTLGAGGKYRVIQVSPDESQFLETIKANADDVARFFFRRPPGEGGSVTYANVEARSLDLLTYTLSGWMVRLEKALTRLRPRPRVVKFNPDGIVRVDLLTRYRAHDIAIRSGLNSRDERRELEDEGPIGDGTGGEHLWPPYATTLNGGPDDRPAQPA